MTRSKQTGTSKNPLRATDQTRKQVESPVMFGFFLMQSLTPKSPRAPEILFKPELIGRDHCGIHESLFKSILSSDIDLRRSLLQNIVLSGKRSCNCLLTACVCVNHLPAVVAALAQLAGLSPSCCFIFSKCLLKVETRSCPGSPSDSRWKSRACWAPTRGRASTSAAPRTGTSPCGAAARCWPTCKPSPRRG